MTIIIPKGWRQEQVLHRLDAGSTLTPVSYDKKQRSVDAILSVGSPVKRIFGTEKLRISPECVDVSRVHAGLVPLLDSHANTSITSVLGRLARTWFVGGELWGKLVFADTEQGRVAEQMVSRGEISSTSLGYRVEQWSIEDSDGSEVDPDDIMSWDSDLTFVATRFQILECSLVSIPADAEALIRKLGNVDETEVGAIRERMQNRQAVAECRERMLDRQQSVSEID
jgi:hypothetical protein